MNAQCRKHVALPEEVYGRLLMLAYELGFKHKGRANIIPMLDALSNAEPEHMEQFIDERGLRE